MQVPAGAKRIGFIFGMGVTPVGTPLVVRQALLDKGRTQSAASAAQQRQAPPAKVPAAPTLTGKSGAGGTSLVATGVQPGRWVLFSDAGRGFAAVRVPPGAKSVTLPASKVPAGGGIFRARQVTDQLVVSLESNAVVF
jgi:hypothetical protein